MQIRMKLFQFDQMVPIAPSLNEVVQFPNLIESVEICPNVSNSMQI